MRRPETQYAECGEIDIAYQVMGDGPIDIVIAPGLFSHVELYLEFAECSEFLTKLAGFARVITFDKRGQGLSDRIDGTPTFEERTDDLRAVMKAVGSERAAIFGISEGGAMALLFAATHPEEVSHVITFGSYTKSCAGPDYPHMPPLEERRQKIAAWLENWGKGAPLPIMMPGLAGSDAARRLMGRIERATSTPNAMRRYFEMNLAIDIREVLPAVRVPTLAMHHENDLQVPIGASRHLADAVPGARFLDCGPGGHLPWSGDIDRVVGEVRNFLQGAETRPQSDTRVLATILFTDIVNSTQNQSDLGDAAWRALLDRHDEEAADLIDLHRGHLVKSTGDGLLATFDGPGRAVQCANSYVEKAAGLGLQVRAGLHTGEVEIRGADIGGTAVHAAARIEEAARPGEVVVQFQEICSQVLKGLPGEWTLLRALA